MADNFTKSAMSKKILVSNLYLKQIELKAYILDTVKSATLLTPPILSPNKKKNAKRPSPNLVSLNTRRRLKKKQSNSATPL